MTAASSAPSTRILNAGFITIFIINVLGQYAVYSMKTLTGPFAGALGAAPTVIGTVSSLFALTAMSLKLVSAPMIDAFNRKWILVLALGILLLSCLLYAFAHNIPLLIISRLFAGAALAFLPTVCFVIVSDAIPPEKLSTAIGWYALGTVLVQAFAPAVSLWLVARMGYNATFGVVAAVVAGTIIFAIFSRIGTGTPTRKFSFRPDSIFSKAVLVPSFILLIEAMVWCQIDAFLVLFGVQRGIPAAQAGLFFTVLAFVLLVSRPLIGMLADRFGSSKILLLCMFFLAGSFLLISFSHGLPLFLLGAGVAAFGYAGCQPALMAICLRLVPTERRGAASCTAYMGQDIGNLIGGPLGGSLVQYLGYAAMWQLMLVPLGIAAIVAVVYRRQLDTIVPGSSAAPAH